MMNIKLLAALVSLNVFTFPLIAESSQRTVDQGTVTVYVKYDNGNPANQAPVYVHGPRNHSIRMVQANEVGATMFAMNAGEYQISSAYIASQTIDGYKNRYASNSARVTIMPGEATTVILTLKPIQANDTETLGASTEMGFLSDASNPSAIAKNY